MADVTVLRCWPACVDAIDWSPDGIIALASDERVELLFPNTVDFDRDHLLPQWQHVPLKVPLFSTDELPLKEPAPISNYSVGEEISNSAPISIAWSPPGLAKHRKCALAALTANLTLSLWSAEGKPQDEASWTRRLIVNDALVDHFGYWDDEPSHVTGSSKERLRLRSRIRAFAWAPALPCPESAGVVGTHLSYGPHMLAVSNDDNHLIFLKIESPTSTFGAERDWSAEVLTHESFAPPPGTIFSEPNVFEDMIKQQRHISHVAWSPWVLHDGSSHSVLVYATNEAVRARTITYTRGRISLENEVIYLGYELRYHGPMKWFHRVEIGDKLKLALFTNTELVYLTIFAPDASIIEKSTHDLDGRWDPVSGVVWDTTETTTRLHISSLLSTLHNPTAVLEQTSNELKTLGIPSWREKIENNLALFSVKNGLKGNSKAKVWGLTRSPLGDFVAACNSVHPSDMIEYGIPADRSGTVAISSLRPNSQQRDIFPKEDVTAEGVTYSLKKLAEDAVEDPDDMPAFAKEMVDKLVQTYTAPPLPDNSTTTSASYSDANDLNSLIEEFKSTAFLNPHTLKDRYTLLVSEACKTQANKDLLKTLIAYRLAVALQQLPASLSHTPFSAEIRVHHKQLIALVNMIMGDDYAQRSLPAVEGGSEHNTASTINTDANGNSDSTGRTIEILMADTCDFCSASIPFTDLALAACTNGHQFPRCGLSSLAIQAPGITKYCGICSTPFLSDEFVMTQEYVDSKNILETGDDTTLTGVAQDGERSQRGEKNSESVNKVNGEGATEQEEVEQDTTGDQESDDSEDEDDVYERRELPVTLARVLFLACDACIYCGGKFVG